MDIIAKIEKLKEERGWTDYELSQQSILTQSTIASIKARKNPPKIDTLSHICEAFGITLSQFFLEDETVEVLTKEERELLANFRKLSPEKKRLLVEILSAK